MNGMLPHSLELHLQHVGPHELLPLADAGLEDKPLGWVRLRPLQVPPSLAHLSRLGCHCAPVQRADRSFVLVRTPEGDRIEIDGDIPGPVRTVDAFVEAFDRAIQARRAGNSVACWQGSNDAISGLLAVALDSPTGAASAAMLPAARLRMPKALREQLKHLRAGLNLRHTLADLRTILNFARSLAGWIGSAVGADLTSETTTLAAQLEADRFWNLRDVARWWAPHVRPDVLWRGRPPAAYAPEGFWEMAERVRLDRFVDLRGATERLDDPYPDDVAGCASRPIGVDPRAGQGDLDESYRTMPFRSVEALGATLEAVAASEGPVLVHCRAGVDRTGVVIALIGSWLEVPRERVLADYLASGQLVEGRRLLCALEAAEDYGLPRLVREAGLGSGVLEAARRRLLA